MVRTYLNQRNRLFHVLGFLLLLFVTYRVFSTAGRSVEEKAVVEELWNDTIALHLKDELWNDKHIYDAGHYLMVPMHAAFLQDNVHWQEQFACHFEGFMRKKDDISEGRLNQLHYYYLLSRFVALANGHGRGELIPGGMADYVYMQICDLWSEKPAWQWEHTDFTGIGERIRWKLATKEVKRSYYRAIIDEELFLFAIAGDLYSFYRGEDQEKEMTLGEILDIAHQVFEKEVEYTTNGGWLLQPGVWAEHPDYAYAGNHNKNIGLVRKPIKDIAMDTSHSHRFPLWLTSLAGACPLGSDERAFYEGLLTGLGNQFICEVLVEPADDFPSYRTTNFMDGRNGVTGGIMLRKALTTDMVRMNYQERFAWDGGRFWVFQK